MAKTFLTEQQLLTGAWYALEQAGILLESAVSLYDARQWSTAIGVAMFGREELGKFEILREFAKSTATEGVTVADVATACAKHIKKQEEGVRSYSLRYPNDSELGKAVLARFEHGYSSPEGLSARRTIDDAMEALKAELPKQRHEMRLHSFYVDITDSGDWRRPVTVTPETARESLEDAVNDYSVLTGNLKIEGWAPDMERAKEAMAQPPQLLPPRWPGWVANEADAPSDG